MLHTIKDRLLQVRLQQDEKRVRLAFIVMGIIIVFLLANIIYLNLAVIKARIAATTNRMDESSSAAISPSPILSPTPCLDCLSPTPTATPPPKATASSTNTIAVKDYFIPLGSGTSQAGDWTDVPGVQATIDFGTYPHIKEIRFEASVHVPTANQSVSVRLFNVTDKHPVWYSEVATSNATAYLTSPPVNYDLGLKVYQVQIKTQLQYPTNLAQSRIHIILE